MRINLHDFTDDQLAFLCDEFNLTTHDLSRLGEYGIQAIYDHLCDMDDEMAMAIIAILDEE